MTPSRARRFTIETGRDLSLQRRIPHRSGLTKERRRGIRRKGRSRATKKLAGSASRRARVFSSGSGGGSGSLDKGFQGRHVCFVLRLPNSFSRHELLVFQLDISPHRSDTPVNKHALNQNTRRFNEHAPHDPELRPITQHSISPFRLPRGAVNSFSHIEGRLSNLPFVWPHFRLPFTRAMPGLPCRHPASAALADS